MDDEEFIQALEKPDTEEMVGGSEAAEAMAAPICIVVEGEDCPPYFSLLGFVNPPDGMTEEEVWKHLESLEEQYRVIIEEAEELEENFMEFIVNKHGYREAEGSWYVASVK